MPPTGASARPVACLGAEADFTPRASFAKNFFESGGIEAVSAHDDAALLPAAFKASGAALVCLCGSDKSYASEAAAAATAAALKAAGARHIYLAGMPGAMEAALRTAGVQTFIDASSDAPATLGAAYDILGVERTGG
jgi:methylmalonyl-CoA mutase